MAEIDIMMPAFNAAGTIGAAVASVVSCYCSPTDMLQKWRGAATLLPPQFRIMAGVNR